MSELPLDREARARRVQKALLLAAGATIALYFIPFGYYVLYPLLLLATFAHEMGHGLAAMAVGSEFEDLRMWADGSGIARHRGAPNAFERALIAAGGLLGPAVLAGLLFVIGRHAGLARAALYIFGAGCLLAVALVVGNVFVLVFVGLVAAVCFFVAYKAAPFTNQVVVVFLAMQLSLSAFSHSDYLFMEFAHTAGGRLLSDTAQIADALGGAYWFWGAVVGLGSSAILIAGLWIFLQALRTSKHH
ncbi:MAG: M50 family peptidase [Gammaproteobacteria bacterium]|nr:M50 family peptidase [Gammaproteobacteria bacterium]